MATLSALTHEIFIMAIVFNVKLLFHRAKLGLNYRNEWVSEAELVIFFSCIKLLNHTAVTVICVSVSKICDAYVSSVSLGDLTTQEYKLKDAPHVFTCLSVTRFPRNIALCKIVSTFGNDATNSVLERCSIEPFVQQHIALLRTIIPSQGCSKDG